MTPSETLSREKAKAEREKLELAMLQQLKAAGLTKGLFRQYEFCFGRKFRADFCWPDAHLMLECNGGTWTVKGAHSRGSGLAKDYEKGANAAILGYRVIHCSGNQIKSGKALGWIEAALRLAR